MAIGWILLIVSGIFFPFKLYVSYTSHGGEDGTVPVLDGAIFPPIFFVVGLGVVLDDQGIVWAWWLYLLIWAGFTFVAYWAIDYAGNLGKRWKV